MEDWPSLVANRALTLKFRGLPQTALPAKAISVGDLAIMKRLIFVAQTAVVALARAASDPNADRSVRKIPAAERISRLADQRWRLGGLHLEGPMEVAHQVYDVMLEADALKYLPPAKRITRAQEITGSKPPKELKLDFSGQGITVKDAQSDQVCPAVSELGVMEAMTRRSLAFDAAGLMDYDAFQN